MAGKARNEFSMQLNGSLTASDRHVRLRSVHHCLQGHAKFHTVEDLELLLYSKSLQKDTSKQQQQQLEALNRRQHASKWDSHRSRWSCDHVELTLPCCCLQSHPKFSTVEDLEPLLYSKALQKDTSKQPEEMTLKEAVQQRIIANETLAYFIGRTFLFLVRPWDPPKISDGNVLFPLNRTWLCLLCLLCSSALASLLGCPCTIWHNFLSSARQTWDLKGVQGVA